MKLRVEENSNSFHIISLVNGVSNLHPTPLVLLAWTCGGSLFEDLGVRIKGRGRTHAIVRTSTTSSSSS